MGCFFALLSLVSPRLALVVIWLVSGWIGEAIHPWWVGLLGFFILPWTTLAYVVMFAVSPDLQVAGFAWFVVAFAFVLDAGSYLSSRVFRR